MRHARLWLAATLSIAIAFLVGAFLFGSLSFGAPVAHAQGVTVTPRPGITTLLTSTSPLATPAATGRIPTPVSIIAIPITGSVVTSTSSTSAGVFPGTITVVGEGRVQTQPDVAHVTIGVETVAPTVKAASDEARKTMDAVVTAIKAQGVPDKDIQTSAFNIYVERIPPQPDKTGPEEVRYHVSNSVNITIRNLDHVSDVLDAAIGAGANNIYGVTFAVENPAKAEADARQKAVADAQRRAMDLARLNGVQVGRVVSISEVIGNQAVATLSNAPQPAMGKGGGGGVQPGELELVMQLQITYAMQ